ncbi:Proton myo-inositol cotransporter [Tupaia chinensis]|uniref:Proton myo-inositol cotransporter n=1 Tax=Tupaia chinensis TaxID=246437 RepID=L8Y3T8_TUPCH|nr:Proton myo-inositol cotransporter [Tupaia chinensis]
MCFKTSIQYYSATILQMSGVEDDRLAIWLASVTAFTNFIFTLVGVWLVEKVGRRKLTFGSLADKQEVENDGNENNVLKASYSPKRSLKSNDVYV